MASQVIKPPKHVLLRGDRHETDGPGSNTASPLHLIHLADYSHSYSDSKLMSDSGGQTTVTSQITSCPAENLNLVLRGRCAARYNQMLLVRMNNVGTQSRLWWC